MNATRHTSIDEQASLWAARLEGSTLTAADRAALDAWLAENTAHRAALTGYCQFSADLEEQLPALVAAGGVKMPEPATPRRASRWNFPWLASLGVAAAAAITVAVWFGAPGLRYEKFAAPVAHRQSVTLPDGTSVELNAHSTLLVEHFRAERRVQLTEGEAFFNVAKDKAHPFIVTTPTGTVRVTGTEFDVHTAPAELDVTVVEGSVRVQPVSGLEGTRRDPPLLGAGDSLSARTSGVSVQKLAGTDVEDLLAWRQGQIVCDGMLLREALARFSRYNGRTLTASPAAENMTVGGRFSLDDVDAFLSALRQMFTTPVRVVRDAGGSIRVSLQSER